MFESSAGAAAKWRDGLEGTGLEILAGLARTHIHYRYQRPRLSTFTALAAPVPGTRRSQRPDRALCISDGRPAFGPHGEIHVSPACCQQHPHWPLNSTSTATARPRSKDLRIATASHARYVACVAITNTCTSILRRQVHAFFPNWSYCIFSTPIKPPLLPWHPAKPPHATCPTSPSPPPTTTSTQHGQPSSRTTTHPTPASSS